MIKLRDCDEHEKERMSLAEADETEFIPQIEST